MGEDLLIAEQVELLYFFIMWSDILASQHLLFMTETQDSLLNFGIPCGNYLDHVL